MLQIAIYLHHLHHLISAHIVEAILRSKAGPSAFSEITRFNDSSVSLIAIAL
jgi:hypothetical protein